MNIGSLIKNIRLAKKIPVQELCSNELNASTLWRIENNKVSPTIDKFLNILHGLGVSPEEFFLQLDAMIPNYNKFKKELRVCSNKNDVKGLTELKENVQKAYNLSNYTSYLHLYYLIDLMISKKNQEILPNLAVIELKKYLFEAEIWGTYEIILLCNCLFIFDISDLDLLVDKAIKAFNLSDDLHNMDIYKAKLIQNVISQYIFNNQTEIARSLYTKFSQLELQSESFYARFIYQWLDNLISLFESNDEKNLFQSWYNTFKNKYYSIESITNN